MSLLTFQDALENLQLWSGGTAMTRAKGEMRHAIHAAQQALYQERRWTFYQSAYTFATRAGLTTGTVGYSHAGLTLTLSTATSLPSWTDSATVLASGLYADVDYKATSHTALMESDFNFGQTIAAGASYTMFQDKFPLPELFQNVAVSVSMSDGLLLQYISPEEYVYRRSFGQDIGLPTTYTIMGDPNVLGRYCIALYPSPNELRTYVVKFQRAYRELKLTGDESTSQAGTVTISSGAKSVTGNSSSFNNLTHKNAILRIGDTTNVPTGIRMQYPWVEQHQIAAVSSASALTLRSAVGQAFTTAKYVITDPIDIPPELEQAFLKRARLELAQCRPDTKRGEVVAMAQMAYEEALRSATAHDSKDDTPLVFGGMGPKAYRIPERPLNAEDA